MKVVDEAFQLFGAGTSREYAIEKLYRDTRVALIETAAPADHALGVLAQPLRRGLVAELNGR
jgi:alkylation response protein AidB-like acyl-CoA dehydrogenase